MKQPQLALVALFALLAGCAGSSSSVLMSEPRPPLDPAQVRIYRSVPPGAVEIAQLQSSSGIGFDTQGQSDAVMLRLRREAAAVGANGLVLFGAGPGPRPSGGVSVGGSTWGSNTGGGIAIGVPTSQQRATALAIYVPEASVQADWPVAPEPTDPPPN